MSNAKRLHPFRSAAVVLIATCAAIVGLNAAAEDAAKLFPSEIVNFQPIEANPIFRGRGKGHWDEHIRERGWILREGNAWRMWFTGFEGGGGYDGTILKLGYATSSDGVRWNRYPENPVYSEIVDRRHDGRQPQ